MLCIHFQTLKLSMTALRETTVGQSVNLLSNDVNRFDSSVIFLVYLWFGPLQTLVMLYLMWLEIGFAAVIGVATILLVIPIQGMYYHLDHQHHLRVESRTKASLSLSFHNLYPSVLFFKLSFDVFFPLKLCYGKTIDQL